MSDFKEHDNYPYYISYYDTDDKGKEFVINGHGEGNGVYALIKLTQPAHDFFAALRSKECFDEHIDDVHHRLWIKPTKLLEVANFINNDTDKVVTNDLSRRGYNDFISDVNQRTTPPKPLVCSVPLPKGEQPFLRSRL